MVVPEAASQLPVGCEGWGPAPLSRMLSGGLDPLAGLWDPRVGGPRGSCKLQDAEEEPLGGVLGSDLPAPAGGVVGSLVEGVTGQDGSRGSRHGLTLSPAWHMELVSSGTSHTFSQGPHPEAS